jgi:DNA-directed RNA polymerase beta subunit
MCILSDPSITSLADMNECEGDMGGYFIQNGVEKVLVSQEKMGSNRIIVEARTASGGTKKADRYMTPNLTSLLKVVTAKVRCAPEMSCKPPSEVSMTAKLAGKGKNCESIKVSFSALQL